MQKKTFWRAVLAVIVLCGVTAGVMYLAGHLPVARMAGFVAGIVFGAAGLWALQAAGRSAPKKGHAAVFYVLHVALTFGPILVAMFVPGFDALGVLIPQLFCVPAFAVCALLEKE